MIMTQKVRMETILFPIHLTGNGSFFISSLVDQDLKIITVIEVYADIVGSANRVTCRSQKLEFGDVLIILPGR